MVFLEFRFLCVLGGRQTPKTVCKGGLDKVTPALQVVIVSHLLGNTREMATVWIVLSGSRCGILGFALASIVTLERCRRSCGGALSRNLYRGSINLWCPADSDRPTDGWAVSLAIFKSDFLVALGWIFAKRSLPLSGRAVVHKPPPVASHAVGYPQCPLSMASIQQGWVVCQPSARPKRRG